MRPKRFIRLGLLLCLALHSRAEVFGAIDSLLIVLDQEVEQSGLYEQQKQERLALIRSGLYRSPLSSEEEYRLNSLLYYEYGYYISDSALYYNGQNLALSLLEDRTEWLQESLIRKAHLLASSGLLSEASQTIREVESSKLPKRLLIEYFFVCENIAVYQSEYATGTDFSDQYATRADHFRDTLLTLLEPGSYMHSIVLAPKLTEHGRLQEAEAVLLKELASAEPDTREDAVISSLLAYNYLRSGQNEKAKTYYARSAIADIRSVVKENKSLRDLAELLYRDGDIKRANSYVKKSMADATFYNARLRNIQSSKILPIIDSAYELDRDNYQQRLQHNIQVISILSAALVALLVYLLIQIKRVKRAHRQLKVVNRELKRINNELAEANQRQSELNTQLLEVNHIKEEYIGHFMTMCSSYIDKMEAYRRMLLKKSNSGKPGELIRTIKSTRYIDEELEEFYQNFDDSFLSIFPDFVETFNELFPPEHAIVPKSSSSLTPELRIYALIRLGITDSNKIASFLRYSVTTIYTYRSKVKKRSLSPETFEDQVMEIGTFSSNKS